MIFISRYVLHLKNTKNTTRNFFKSDKTLSAFHQSNKKQMQHIKQQQTTTVFSYVSDEEAEGNTKAGLPFTF